MHDLLARIDAFRPTDDNWRELDTHVQALACSGENLWAALPTLLRVFERYPRHDGHGVFWGILHLVESITGYEAILLEHVQRSPTEMGITMIQRIVNAGLVRIGVTELQPLLAKLAPLAPVIDCTIEPLATPTRSLDTILVDVAAFMPSGSEFDWSPLLVLVAQALDTKDLAIVTPLLQTLDRFHTYDGFSPFWPIVRGLEQLPGFPSALVTSVRTTPTRYGTTLLLRLLARQPYDVDRAYLVDGVDIAALAVSLIESRPS
jgi:hypothetical protein